MSIRLFVNSVLILGLFFFSACKLFEEKAEELRNESRTVARVGSYYLHEDDLQRILGENMSPEDSIEACNFFINDWIKNRLMLVKSKQYLPDDLKEIDRQATEYKESLMTYLYESKLIQQNLDTLVSAEEVADYYEANQANFVLRNPIVKSQYFILPPESPSIDSLRHWFTNQIDENVEKLSDYGFQYASKFSVEGEWFEFREFQSKFPIETDNLSSYLQNNEFLELNDPKNLFVAHIDTFIFANEIAPLAFKKTEIEKIIVKLRKMKFTRELKNKVYEDALKKGEFDIYENN